ncbi:MAG: CPBP family intramembrane metalloprotease [Bacteroidales bacterium]|nr:CPBP family intramembrane metalloprotease [Bacteroidales bacterium]
MPRKRVSNYRLLDNYAHYVPGPLQLLGLVGFFIVGVILANGLMLLASRFDSELAMTYGTLVTYPLMFIPAMMYAGVRSRMGENFETGYSLDSGKFKPFGAVPCVILSLLSTFALAFLTDALAELLPPMPQALKDALERLTEGSLVLNFIAVSVMAPFFEEWLCRGMVLRGLLNYKKEDGFRGLKPIWAVVISAAFFALIHLNPWQALPAFILGALFGYVYYKTGSLKLTMLMHCANNTLSLAMSRIPSLKDAENWREVLPSSIYWVVFGVSILLLILCIFQMKKISLTSPQGNCSEVKSLFDSRRD